MNRVIAGILLGVAWMGAAQAGPREECAAAGATMPCLDARLKEANKQLNGTLKAAQERLEQLQARGGRPMMGAFVDSQRKFNAYRDAQCSWQGVRARAGENTAEYVRACQIEETLKRDELLGAFARGGEDEEAGIMDPPTPEAVTQAAPETAPPDIPAPAAVDPVPAPPKAVEASQDAGSRGAEWRLSAWTVGGQQKVLLQDSTITIAFDPSGKVAGTASVNRYSGTYRFDADGRLVWPKSFAVTRMAATPVLMAQERAFLESLRRTSRYRVDDSGLVLESANASVVLTFSR